jgi:CBS domain-containing protein
MPQHRLVRDIMSSPPITVGQDTPAPEVAKLMRDKDIGAVIVTDPGGRMVGIITESDFTGMGRCVPFSLDLAPVIFGMRAANLDELRRIYAMARELTARQIMHDQVATVRESESIGRAAQLMMNQGHKHLPVVRDGKPVGMLARHDMLKLLQYAP